VKVGASGIKREHNHSGQRHHERCSGCIQQVVIGAHHHCEQHHEWVRSSKHSYEQGMRQEDDGHGKNERPRHVQAGHGRVGVVRNWDAVELAISDDMLHGVLEMEDMMLIDQPSREPGRRQWVELVAYQSKQGREQSDVAHERKMRAVLEKDPDSNRDRHQGLTDGIDEVCDVDYAGERKQSEKGVRVTKPDLECRLNKEAMRLLKVDHLPSMENRFLHIGRINVSPEDVVSQLQARYGHQLEDKPDPGSKRGPVRNGVSYKIRQKSVWV